MKTQLLKINHLVQDGQKLDQAAKLLREGKLVAIPTETVYGLAANALDPDAAAAIYQAKGRPSDNPLIVHIAQPKDAQPLVQALPDVFFRLAQRFWPGPMTIILKKSAQVPSATSGGLDTVALRIPAHPIARELILRAGVPLAAPSANLSGSPSPTSATHCVHDLTGRVDAIVDGGECEVGVESTVLTLCTNPPKILRPGAVTLEMLREVLPDIELDAGVFEHLADDAKAASPGMKYKHYAPKARVVLVHSGISKFVQLLKEYPDAGALCFEEDVAQITQSGHTAIVYGKESDPKSQAHMLFGALRRVDDFALAQVFVRISDENGIGQAVYNRLLRAAGFEVIRL